MPRAALLPGRGTLPEDASARLGHDDEGRCLFLETRDRGLCSVHRQLGVAALPSACRQFPRVCVIEEDRVSVSLSHYCPTAAALLPGDGDVHRLPSRVGLPPGVAWEGLDARRVGARQLRSGVLLDVEAREEWERRGLETLAAGDDPDVAVGQLASSAESARTWRTAEAPLADRVVEAFDAPPLPPPAWEHRIASAARVHGAIPDRWRPRDAVPEERAFEERVRPVWRREARLVGRYLAARFFACWALFQGGGLRSHAAWVRLALDTLAVETARREGVLGSEDLIEAISETDRRLLHLADPGRLARGLEEVAPG